METVDPVDELTCSECRSIYTDPVSLKCGDSFCWMCIHHVQDRHVVFGQYSCPRCNKRIRERPLLPRNTQLLHALQCYGAEQGGGHVGEAVAVHCLYCVEAAVPAVKTCVQCETPLCDQHLEAHNKELNHILIPPTATASLAYRKCSEHSNLLQYYCSQDAACVCESCCVTGNHQGHDIMSVNEAFDIERMKLQNFLCKLKLREEKIGERMQSMEDMRSKLREKAQALRKKINDFFKVLRKQVSQRQNLIKNFLYKRMQKISRPELTRRLHKQKEALSRKIRHVEELCTINDPISLLQKVQLDKDHLSDDPDQEIEQINLIPSIDLSENVINAFLQKGLSGLGQMSVNISLKDKSSDGHFEDTCSMNM